MTTPPFLSPDEDQHHDVHLSVGDPRPAPPYEVAAMLAGLAFMLLFPVLFRHREAWQSLVVGLSVTVFVFAALYTLRPRLNLTALCILATELGMLYSLPALQLYSPQTWLSLPSLLSMLIMIVGAGIVGLIIAVGLLVEAQPRKVIAIGFFLMFVTMTLFWNRAFFLPIF
jgi:hypothetical protein